MKTVKINSFFRYFIILIFLIVLSGCDPKNPTGIRYFVYEKDKGEILAVAYFYGIDQEDFYTYIESGRYWKARNFEFYETPDIISPGDIWLNCSTNCEFQDLLNPNIYYRISEGKRLEISKDAREHFDLLLEIPAWNKMQQNYVLKQYPAYVGPISLEIRGPFYAITDPSSGNIFVAMGVEGILVIRPEKDWKFVSVGPYEYLKAPDNLSMLKLIEKESWIKGILISELTFIFAFLVGNRRKANWLVKLTLFISMTSVVVSANNMKIIGLLPDFFLDPDSQLSICMWKVLEQVFKIYPYVLMTSLFVICVYLPLTSKVDYHIKLKRYVLLSLFCVAMYYNFFILWSQGKIIGYDSASVMGIFSWLILLLVSYVLSRIYFHRQKKLLLKIKNEGDT